MARSGKRLSASAAADQLPDEPALVFLRWLLRNGRCRVVSFDPATGAGVFHSGEHGAVWAVGDESEASLHEEIAASGYVSEVRAVGVDPDLAGWSQSVARVFRLDAPPPAIDDSALHFMTEDDEHPVRMLGSRMRMAAFFAYPRLPVAVYREGEQVITLCCLYAETEQFAELSIDTVGWRRREGHAFRTAAWMAAAARERGKIPVWTAEATNDPSIRLAERLGFQPAGEFHLYRPNRGWPD